MTADDLVIQIIRLHKLTWTGMVITDNHVGIGSILVPIWPIVACISVYQAMVEAIGLLDQLCLRDPSLIPRVFEAIKRVFNQYSTSRPRVLIPILQFFINHSEFYM